MKDLQDKLDELLVKNDCVYNLAVLLEDYFYMCPKSRENDFEKYGALSTVVVEKIKEIDKFINDEIWDFIKK